MSRVSNRSSIERVWQQARVRSAAVMSVMRLRRRTADSGQVGRKRIRMGFVLDIVGYSRRRPHEQKRLQQRLDEVSRLTFDDQGIALSDVDRQGTGDGLLVILPEWVDVQRALPRLLASISQRLTEDNSLFQDRMRVRMAADVGPVRVAELGFDGGMVTNMARLLDSEPLRQWVIDHPEQDLSVVLSDSLHRFVVAEGTPELPAEQFTQVQVQVSEGVSATAWLSTR